MKGRCIVQEYFDIELQKYIKKNETIESSKERLEFLANKGFVEILKDKPAQLNKDKGAKQ